MSCFKVLSQHLSEGTEKIKEHLSQDSWPPGRASNMCLPAYEVKAVTSEQKYRYIDVYNINNTKNWWIGKSPTDG